MAEELMRIAYHRSDNLVADSERIIETAQGNAYQAVNLLLVERNWLLGKRISEEIANGDGRTEYGSEVMKKLARALTAKYGRGLTMTNLYYYFSFLSCPSRSIPTHCVENLPRRFCRGRIIGRFSR